jgi:hypothetical protein
MNEAEEFAVLRQFYVAFPQERIRQTTSGKSAANIRQTLLSKSETLYRICTLDGLAEPVSSWSRTARARVNGRDADEEGVAQCPAGGMCYATARNS